MKPLYQYAPRKPDRTPWEDYRRRKAQEKWAWRFVKLVGALVIVAVLFGAVGS